MISIKRAGWPLTLIVLLAGCIHGQPRTPWTYTEETRFVTEPGEPKLEVRAVCRSAEFWYGRGTDCFTKTCPEDGPCEEDGDPAIIAERKEAEAHRARETRRLQAQAGKSCQRGDWSDCLPIVDELFDMQAFKEAQALKEEACSHPKAECRYVSTADLKKLELKHGEKILWQRDLRSTWSSDMFFAGPASKTPGVEYVDLIILKP